MIGVPPSSMDKGVDREKKGQGPKLFESKKERRKRQLILSDSESEEDLASTCKKVPAVTGPDQTGNKSVFNETNSIDHAEKSSDEAMEVTRSEVVKQSEGADTGEKMVTESGLGGKRSRETVDAEIGAKKTKTESVKCGGDQDEEEASAKSLKRDFVNGNHVSDIRAKTEGMNCGRDQTEEATGGDFLDGDQKTNIWAKTEGLNCGRDQTEEETGGDFLDGDQKTNIRAKTEGLNCGRDQTEEETGGDFLDGDQKTNIWAETESMKCERNQTEEQSCRDNLKGDFLNGDQSSDSKGSIECERDQIKEETGGTNLIGDILNSDEKSDIRSKTESMKCGRDQSDEETDGKNMKRYSPSVDQITDRRADDVLASVAVVSEGRQRDGLSEKRLEANLKKANKPEAADVRRIEFSSQRILRKLKNNSNSPVGVKREEFGIPQNGISVQGTVSVLRVLRSNKKVGGLEEVCIQKEDEENIKCLRSSTTVSQNRLNHTPFSGKKEVIQKSGAAIKLRKKGSSPGKSSSSERSRLCKVKIEPEISSARKNLDSSNRKAKFIAKGESRSESKTSRAAKKNTEEASVGCLTAKQKLKKQIKKILLDAGWEIELRPRRGRDYQDAVYKSPRGGAGYWSITKAYAVYQDELNTACGEKSKRLSAKSVKQSIRRDRINEGTTIPLEALSMLKRNVVNKRRRRKELDEAQKKVRDSRSKKGKGIDKHSKDTGGTRGTRKPNNFVAAVGSKAQRNQKQRGRAMLARQANQVGDSDDDYVPYAWKRTVLSWMIDLGVVPENGKVKYMNKKQTRTLLEGEITRDGILCSCCSKSITVPKFEVHAGSKLNQAYQNTFVEEAGLSLFQCQLLAWEKQEDSERQGFYNIAIDGDDPNDDTCGICGDGGDLICCDGCPSTFHVSCLGIGELPPGDWHCAYCSCRFCGAVSYLAAHESGATVSPLLSCSQCEQKYHQKCVPKEDAVSVSSTNEGTSFCGQSCQKVSKSLQKLLGFKNELESGLSWSIIRRFDEDSSLSECFLPQRAECNSKIAVALAVMDECFLPIIDKRSHINLIHNVVYNCRSNFNRLNYSGFYTFILERGDEIISVASVRIHGTRLAEMPFIGTRNMYRNQGMCRRLLNGIEMALWSLNVEKLIIPAISELEETWTKVFGFKHLEIAQKEEVLSINMLVFPGTGLLQKSILEKASVQQDTAADEGD